MSQASITECNAANDAANALLNSGTIKIQSGAEGDIDSGTSGSLLETFVIPSTAFNASSNRVATMNLPIAITATSNGSAPYHYEAYDSGVNIRRSGTLGTSGTDMIINQATWSIGDTLTITAWSTTQPK